MALKTKDAHAFGDSSTMKFITLRLTEVNQIPGGFYPHVVGTGEFLGGWKSGNAVPMKREDKTWQLSFISSSTLHFSFLLKPKGVPTPCIFEETPRRAVSMESESEDHAHWPIVASFRLPKSSDSSDVGPLLEFPVSFSMTEVSPIELGLAWEKYNEDAADSTEYPANLTEDPHSFAVTRNEDASDDSPSLKLRQKPMHSVLSIKDLVLLGKEADESDSRPHSLNPSHFQEAMNKRLAPSPAQSPPSMETASHDNLLSDQSRNFALEPYPEASGAVEAAAVADGLMQKERRRLAIVMVGLPARGKTFTAARLARYLRWLGHDTKHFNVGKYRRTKLGSGQDSDFFRADNVEGVEARHQVARTAFSDMLSWMDKGGQVGIFDATNSTRERREMLLKMAGHRCKVIFVESMCTDSAIIERNCRQKIKASPDYAETTDLDLALADFKARLAFYEQVYEPVSEGSYIKLIDMVGGGGQMQLNNISGYLPSRIVFFLVNSHTVERPILLTRHGESEANVSGRIGGDPGLSSAGEQYACKLAEFVKQRLGQEKKASIWTSTLQRTILTARHSVGFPKVQWRALVEIDAGVCDGMTYEEIKATMPEEYNARKADKLRYRYPQGESYLDVIQRLEPVIIELERQRSPVVVVAHQAILRALYAYFTDKPLPEIPHIEVPLHTVIELSIGLGVKEKRHCLMEKEAGSA